MRSGSSSAEKQQPAVGGGLPGEAGVVGAQSSNASERPPARVSAPANGAANQVLVEPDRKMVEHFLRDLWAGGLIQIIAKRPFTAKEAEEERARASEKGRRPRETKIESRVNDPQAELRIAADFIVGMNAKGHDIYFCVNPVRDRTLRTSAAKPDIARIAMVPVDIDLVLPEGGDYHTEREKLRAQHLPGFIDGAPNAEGGRRPQATFTTSSGHGVWGFYRLAEPIELPLENGHVADDAQKRAAEVEHITRRVGAAFDGAGDAVCNVNRLARLPGTLNHKRKSGYPPVSQLAVVLHEGSKRYRLEELADGLPELKRKAVRGIAREPAPLLAEDTKWRREVVSLLDAADLRLLDESEHDDSKYPSRSEHVPGVIARLARAGKSREEIFQLLANAPGTRQYATDHRGGNDDAALAFLWSEVETATEWFAEQQAEKKDALDEELSDWLENVIFVEDGSKVADIRRPGTARLTGWNDFARANANRYVVVGTGDKATRLSKVKSWLAHEERKTARGTTWDPHGGALVEKVVMQADGTEERVLFVNTYQRKHHRAELADPTLLEVFREQVAYMYGTDAWMFEEFIAHRVQYPWERPTIALLSVAGDEGTGRGWLNVVIGGVLGEWNVKKVTAKNFAGPYDDHKVECIDMFVEEIANAAGKKWEMDADVRDAISSRYGEVNHKYGKTGQEDFYASVRLETNHRDAVKLTEKDRRLMVLEVTSPIRPNEHFARLYQLAQGERRDAFFSSVYHYLASLDLTRFRALNRAPMSRAKQSLISATNTDIEKAIVELLERCPARAVMPADVMRWIAGQGIETYEHEHEVRAVLRNRAFKPFDEHRKRVRDPADADRAKREQRKVAPWILRSQDRELSFTDLQSEVVKAHRWIAAETERDHEEDADDDFADDPAFS